MARERVISTSRATTPRTIRPAIRYLLFGDERRGAVDLHHVHPLSGLEHGVLVVAAGGPHLAADLDGAAVGVDTLEHHRPGPDEGRGSGSQPRGRAQVAPGDRAQQTYRRDRRGGEREKLEDHATAGERDSGREHGGDRDRPEEEAHREDLAGRERAGGDHPDHPLVHRDDPTQRRQSSLRRRAGHPGARSRRSGARCVRHSRIARAKSSGSKGLRSSSASPMPISLTGTPSSWAIASAMPPLAVPSSLVRAIPVTFTASRKSSACRRPFWPVVASIVSSVSWGAPGAWRSITLRTLRSSSIRCCWVWRRPAVSTTTTSWPRALAASIASNATAPGSEPGSPRTISQFARFAQVVSCSAAAARKVSAAASSTDSPSSCCRCQAILPMVVVLPLPFTPTTSSTAGLALRSTTPSSRRAESASSSRSRRVRSSPPLSSPDCASSSSRSTIIAVVGAPTSA